MIRRHRASHTVSLAALALAVLAYLASPPAPRAQSQEDPLCNINNTGQVCKIQEDCAWFLFFKKCTTQYWRQPGTDPGGGGEDEDEDGNPIPV